MGENEHAKTDEPTNNQGLKVYLSMPVACLFAHQEHEVT